MLPLRNVSPVTLSDDPKSADTADRSAADDRLRAALGWHLGWSAATLIALVAMASVFRDFSATTGAALLLAAAPGLLAQLLRWDRSSRPRFWIIGIWAGAGAAAAALTGGVGGPLVAWTAAPLLAALVLGRRLVPAAAALSLSALAMALWIGVTGAIPSPPETQALWLSFTAMATLAGGMATALALSAREVKTARPLERALREQPHTVLAIAPSGRVVAAYGERPGAPGLDTDIAAHARPQDREALTAALGRALEEGSGEIGFAPAGAPNSYLRLSVRRGPNRLLYGVLRDATAERDREQSLEAAHRRADSLNQGKSRFLANMSHELRTPLNAVIGFSDIMRQRMFGPLPDRYAEYAQLIHESGGHLLDLINDVLDMSKIEADRYRLDLDAFDAREAVNAALRLVRLQAHESGVALRGMLPPAVLPVRADRRAIKQIVLNLLSNALKFTHEGGSITVTLESTGDALELTVADTGMGIAAEDLERIGRPYEQAGDNESRSRGTGLGLSLVRALAELHGGTVAIESTLGEGTAVTVRLPVIVDASELPVRVPDPAQPTAEIIPLKSGR